MRSTTSRRRHLTAALFGGALLAALLAASGPVVRLRTPTGTPVVLIIDISRSMEETDIRPSRIEAARSAAREFVRRLPRESRVALVSFGNFATVVVPLTDRREAMIDGINGLRTQLRTQLGPGLLEGVRAVTGEGPAMPLPAGTAYRAAAILLSDGRASDGILPEEAAQEARRRGVRVYTVGLGTTADPSAFRSGYFGVLDEPTLRTIADVTGGRYYRAEEVGQLHEIYRDLARTIGWTRNPTEIAHAGAAIAALLLAAAVALRVRLTPIG
ncbi:MAG: VWA domain-containing protein [Armatimonadota bacterium]|nr:VWA domain-containing protein [Armatimonadota bacterium]MDR7452536.1 VWA domain-containing protein [Armatimonadota bacterium]MDR7467763.1 VWA domain-containing protein [Armatimonadota bacterium]MDR7494963.1 VWA domain-containing protein [Armatimonadota bacterium]MDR7499772.1 VWA domain-containing protein [Armatimonadota bacterium]